MTPEEQEHDDAQAREEVAKTERRLRFAHGLVMLRALGGRRGPARNRPCPCGSGRKYKRCCLGKLKSN